MTSENIGDVMVDSAYVSGLMAVFGEWHSIAIPIWNAVTSRVRSDLFRDRLKSPIEWTAAKLSAGTWVLFKIGRAHV